MDINKLKTSHDSFIIGSSLILHKFSTIEKELEVKKKSQAYLEALNSNKFNIETIVGFIKKIFTIMTQNMPFLLSKNDKLFSLTETRHGKTIRITLLSGIDFQQGYNNISEQDKQLVWKYLKYIYVSSVDLVCNGRDFVELEKLREEINKEYKDKEIVEDDIVREYMKLFPDNKLVVETKTKEKTLNVYEGVGNNDTVFSVEQAISGPKLLPDQVEATNGVGSLLKLIGIDKMLNMDDLAEQLRNIKPEEIKEAIANIKGMLGKNLDEGTSQIIEEMLENISEELHKKDNTKTNDAYSDIMKVADTVAKNIIPKFNNKNVDPEKIIQSTQNLTNNFNVGGNNPLSMLSGIMNKQMEMAKNLKNNNPKANKKIHTDMMKEYKNMMKGMGANGVNMDILNNMPGMNNSDSSKKSKKKK